MSFFESKSCELRLKAQIVNSYHIVCQILGFETIRDPKQDLQPIFSIPHQKPLCDLCEEPLHLSPAFDLWCCTGGHRFPCCQRTGSVISFQTNLRKCVVCCRFSLAALDPDSDNVNKNDNAIDFDLEGNRVFCLNDIVSV